MTQIADWLRRIGLEQYAQRFAENDIDFSILNDLTDQDLEKIGVASLGHRRKILRRLLRSVGRLRHQWQQLCPDPTLHSLIRQLLQCLRHLRLRLLASADMSR
jgi:hypothetical protein